MFAMIGTPFTRPTPLDDIELRSMDLLARQLADHAWRREADRLLIAKRALELLADQSGAAITHCSRELRYLSANESYGDLLGKPIELIVGQSIPEVVGDAAFRVVRPWVDRVLAGERVEYEAEITFADVGLQHVHAVYVPGFDLQGSVWGWVEIIDHGPGRKAA